MTRDECFELFGVVAAQVIEQIQNAASGLSVETQAGSPAAA